MVWKQPKTDWAGKSDADGNLTHPTTTGSKTTLQQSACWHTPFIQHSPCRAWAWIKKREITCTQMKSMSWKQIWRRSVARRSQNWRVKRKHTTKTQQPSILLSLTESKNAAWICTTILRTRVTEEGIIWPLLWVREGAAFNGIKNRL